MCACAWVREQGSESVRQNKQLIRLIERLGAHTAAHQRWQRQNLLPETRMKSFYFKSIEITFVR